MNLAQALIGYAQSRGKRPDLLLEAMNDREPQEVDRPGRTEPRPPSVHDEEGHAHSGGGSSAQLANGFLYPGTSWKGTHITDNLDWNQGAKTAIDIMAKPGTWVGAPEAGTIVRHGGAQGGQAMYFDRASDPDSDPDYWLGHIDSMLPVGTRVKRRQRIARISAEHAAPHLHIDRDY
jgi:hypothetical protein